MEPEWELVVYAWDMSTGVAYFVYENDDGEQVQQERPQTRYFTRQGVRHER